MAFVRSHIAPHRMHIPLSNLPREDLALRIELGPVLGAAGLDSSDLITLSDIPEDLDPKDTEWLLVDHNCLTGPLKKFENRIIGCIDHHVDEGAISAQTSPRVIEVCGSCMSLVVDTYKNEWRSLVQGEQTSSTTSIRPEYTQLAQVALAPILIDTIDLKAEAKVKPKDLSSAKLLTTELMDASGFDQDAYYDAITAAKEDLSQLSLHDILRKDYKEWEEGGLKLGVSCAVQNFDFLLEKAAASSGGTGGSGQDVLLREMSAWAEQQKLDIVSIMTTSNPGGEFQRHLLVWGLGSASKKAVQRFKEDATGKLKLEAWHDGLLDEQGVRYAWRQMDLDSSRKQVAPLLRDAMKVAGANL